MAGETQFMFATGIECSYPTVPKPGGGHRRVDELELTCHYENWRLDFERVREIGLSYLRYGPPYYRVHVAPGKYDWGFTDDTLNALREMKIVPIVDLCHFGVPEWVGNFQNRDWPRHFAEYSAAFADRFPWVKLYTPVNEIYTTALNSGRNGLWNEALSSDEGFVRALANLCKANILAMQAILEEQPEATFIQSEASQYYHAQTPKALDEAYFMNELRFLSLDLTYGYPVAASMYRYLISNGMTDHEFDWFMNQSIRAHCIMGTDYYGLNEHTIDEDGKLLHVGPTLGYYAITWQYYSRYRLPVMLTETNTAAPEAVDWLTRTWANVYRLIEEGIPVQGFTWYSLTDQVDWDSALTEDNHHINPFGLYDLDRKIRPVGKAYRELVQNWQDAIPTKTSGVRHIRW